MFMPSSQILGVEIIFCDERLELVEVRINGQMYDKAVCRIYPMTSPLVNLSFATPNSLERKDY